MIRKASAVWRGDLKSGNGTMTAPSGVMTGAAYSFATRFEEKPGTNPEELIAAAHAGCFSMALSAELGKAGMTPDRIETTAAVTLEPRLRRQRLYALLMRRGFDGDTIEQALREGAEASDA